MSLNIQKLTAGLGKKDILKHIDITINPGEIHVIMGPNGSGKSTLANTLAGHPKYTVTSGDIIVDNVEVTDAPPDERAKKGIFLSPQHPPEIPGITVANFLRSSVQARTGKKQHPIVFFNQLKETAETLDIDAAFLSRHLNVGFSGGEKKKFEILQLLVLNPQYAVFDEIDSGLDVDALKLVCKGINNFKRQGKGILFITHYNNILKYISPDHVHIMLDGKIVDSGDKELAKNIEKEGFESYKT